jgi:NitT/TauT family transport system substrate-binding protein
MAPIDRRRVLQAGLPLVFGLSRTGSAAEKPEAVLAAHSVHTAIYATHMAALELGYLREEGLELKIITTGGGSKSREVLAAAQVQFALGDTTHPLQLTNRGKPAHMLMVTDTRCSYANIVVRRDLFDQGIDSVEKLGKWRRPGGAKPIIAATAMGSGTWVYGSYVLREKGLETDFNWVGGGETQTILGGLKSRQFDAIMAVPAWIFEAEDNGFGKTIWDVRQKAEWDRSFGGDFPSTAAYALDDFTAKSPALVQAYVNAMYRAQKWLLATPAEQITATLHEKFMDALPESTVRREFEFYKTIFHPTGTLSPAEFQHAAKVWFGEETKIEKLGYDQAFDGRFLAAAAKKYA